MKWEKLGLVFNPAGKLSWASNTALQPTPLILEDRIRVYAGFRDQNGISRIGWVDVDKNDPTTVLQFSTNPVLEPGLPGTFDDNGVVPSAVVARGDEVYLYYAGYQLGINVRFLVLGGLAISKDGGNTFQRYSHVPILERTHKEFLFRVIHTVMYDNGKWKVWYGGGNHFINSGTKTLPVYDIRYMESEDGIHFPVQGTTVLGNGVGEHRVGRPYVIKRNGSYEMYFGASTPEQPYRLAFARSADGLVWEREDSALDLAYPDDGFDSEMSAYPAVVTLNSGTFMFYNGNQYGREGFGVARLIP